MADKKKYVDLLDKATFFVGYPILLVKLQEFKIWWYSSFCIEKENMLYKVSQLLERQYI